MVQIDVRDDKYVTFHWLDLLELVEKAEVVLRGQLFYTSEKRCLQYRLLADARFHLDICMAR